MALDRFRDRADAGRQLAAALGPRDGALVLGLPRGGVSVAAEIAEALNLPLDVLIVRKLGVPGQEELAFGAIAGDDIMALIPPIVEQVRLTNDVISEVVGRERAEMTRRTEQFASRPLREMLAGQRLIIVDDGLATGATMEAALLAAREAGPAHIVVAVPAAAPDVAHRIARLCDEFVCLIEREPFYAVGAWYDDFRQVEDAEVIRILAAHRRP